MDFYLKMALICARIPAGSAATYRQIALRYRNAGGNGSACPNCYREYACSGFPLNFVLAKLTVLVYNEQC